MCEIGYIREHDIQGEYDKLSGANVPIKISGKLNRTCMANFLRIFKAVSSGESFHVIVVFCRQSGDNKVLKSIVQVDLTSAGHLLFGSASLLGIEEFDRLVKTT